MIGRNAVNKIYSGVLREIRYPFADFISKDGLGPQYAVTYGILGKPDPNRIITGPCFLTSPEIKKIIGGWKTQDEVVELLGKSPTFQNIVTMWSPEEGNGVMIMETKEYARMENLDPKEVLPHVKEAADRTLGMFSRYQKMIGSKAKLKPFYTHEPENNELIKEGIRNAVSKNPGIRYHKFLNGEDILDNCRLRIEFTYTPEFAAKVVGVPYTVGENYKHGTQMVTGDNILQSIMDNAIETGKLNFLGLLPPKSLDGKLEMDNGDPLYLGDIELLKNQLKALEPSENQSLYLCHVGNMSLFLGEKEYLTNCYGQAQEKLLSKKMGKLTSTRSTTKARELTEQIKDIKKELGSLDFGQKDCGGCYRSFCDRILYIAGDEH